MEDARYWENIPWGLPSTWHHAWIYTLSRHHGADRREIIRYLLEKDLLHEFAPMMVFSKNLEDWVVNYYEAKSGNVNAQKKDIIRCVLRDIESKKKGEAIFEHDKETSDYIVDYLQCKRTELGNSKYSYYWY